MKNQFLGRFISSLAVILLFLASCSPPSSSVSSSNVELVQTDSRQEVYQETIRLNNCGGTRDAEQTITRSFSTNIEGNVTIKAGYQVVEGSIGAKYGEAKNVIKSIKVVAAPGTDMEYTLEWTEQTWIGRITASNETGSYIARSPISVAQVGANNLGCASTGNSIPIQDTPVPSSNNSSFTATSPLMINGVSYFVPQANTNQGCVASEQTGLTNQAVNYTLQIPQGWVTVWDSWKANWGTGSYNNDGLLIIYGSWEGVVSVTNGEYCAVPFEWADYAINLRRNGNPKPNRQEYIVSEQPTSGLQASSSDPRDVAAWTIGYENLDGLMLAFEIPASIKSRIFVCPGEETWCLGVMEESGQPDFNFLNITRCTLDGKQSNGISNIPPGFRGTIKGFTLRPCR